ncbi:MAG TPA: branched-chain amino acid ABC transporter substrate-binding protein [Gaiellaceae bacterium]|jgi:branched-chain amino acid transport system substrate-binding protein
MLKKVGALGALGAAIAVAVASTFSGTAAAKSAAAATISCTSKVAIGFAYPQTGPAASLGAPQIDWANQAVAKWNGSHSVKIKLIKGDTQLGNGTSHAISVAQAFKSNGSIVAVSGPAGSQEMQDTATIWKGAGLAPVSGSETRVQLTRAQGSSPRQTTPGYFYRTVPNDGQQGDNVATYIHKTLKSKKVLIIDDSEAYSTGLRDQVKADLQAVGVTVNTNHITQSDTNFSSVIASIPSGTDLIYIPWQLPPQAQNFYTQLHAAGKNITLFGSDGTDDPSTFKGVGSYVSAFPYDPTSSTVKSFTSHHGGNSETFGLPSYTSVWVNATAIQAACKAHGNHITRAQVRVKIPAVQLTTAQSLLGFPVKFLSSNKGKYQGPGDMGGTAGFGIYKIQSNHTYKRVG